jgi:hypothetical protein
MKRHISNIAANVQRGLRNRGPSINRLRLNNLQQQKNKYDGENQAKAAAAIVTKPRSHAVAAKSKNQNEYDQKQDRLPNLEVENFVSFGC